MLQISTGKITRWFDYVIELFARIAGVLTLVVALVIVFEVLKRAFMGKAMAWVVDATGYSLVFITFLAAAWILKHRGHVSVDILVDHLSPKTRRAVSIATSATGAFLSAMFFWASLQITLDAIRLNQVHVSSVIFPKWPILIIMPIGSLLLAAQFIRETISYIRRQTPPDGHELSDF